MKLEERLKMMQVKRYPICHTNKQQSVAEHSFGVMLIAAELCEHLVGPDVLEYSNATLAYALVHDQDEVYSGDIASPFKRELRAKCPEVVEHLDQHVNVPDVSKAIVKLADYLEAIHFLHEYGGSRTAEAVLVDIQANFDKALRKYEAVLPWGLLSRARELGQTI